MGASAGGMVIIRDLLMKLPANFSLPIAIVQHVSPCSDGSWAKLLNDRCQINIKEADDKEPFTPHSAYFAPANYHLLIEQEGTFTLTVDEAVSFSRPSIDVLFETASYAYGPHLVGILMTGANADGANGLRCIANAGGFVIVQDPVTAQAPTMPQAGIDAVADALVLDPTSISHFLLNLHDRKRYRYS